MDAATLLIILKSACQQYCIDIDKYSSVYYEKTKLCACVDEPKPIDLIMKRVKRKALTTEINGTVYDN